jgi:hypothetical protein
MPLYDECPDYGPFRGWRPMSKQQFGNVGQSPPDLPWMIGH